MHQVVGVIPRHRERQILLRVVGTERAIAQNIIHNIWTHPILIFMT
jgi:hypothetical protein